jgi:hypothetical protein
MNMRLYTRIAFGTIATCFLMPGVVLAGQWQMVSDNGRMGLMVDISSIQKTLVKRLIIDRIAIDNTESNTAPIEISTIEIDCLSVSARTIRKRRWINGGQDEWIDFKTSHWATSNTAEMMCPRPNELQDYGITPGEAARNYRSLTAFQANDLPAANATLRQLILSARAEARTSGKDCNAEMVSAKLDDAALHAISVAQSALSMNEREKHYRLSRRAVWQAMQWVDQCRNGPLVRNNKEKLAPDAKWLK